MRPEYTIGHLLVWDADFRRSVRADTVRELERRFPTVNVSAVSQVRWPGVDEEAFRRLASIAQTWSAVAPKSYVTAKAFHGAKILEGVAAEIGRLLWERGQDATWEYSLFSETRISSAVKHTLNHAQDGPKWIADLHEYEIACWRAVCVANSGADPLGESGLGKGVSMIVLSHDPRQLSAEIDRLLHVSLPDDIFRSRVTFPVEEQLTLCVFPRSGEIVEFVVPPTIAMDLRQGLAERCGPGWDFAREVGLCHDDKEE